MHRYIFQFKIHPVAALIAGIFSFIFPYFLYIILGAYLIIVGLMGLGNYSRLPK